MILMAYGPFRFSMDTFSYEEMTRKLEARLQSVDIIDARPSLHKMGLGLETISIKSTFFPFHLPNNQGLSQVNSMRAAVGQSYPLLAMRAAFGDYTGMWALKSIEVEKSEIHPSGEGQKIDVTIELNFDGQSRSASLLSSVFQLFG